MCLRGLSFSCHRGKLEAVLRFSKSLETMLIVRDGEGWERAGEEPRDQRSLRVGRIFECWAWTRLPGGDRAFGE